jgi:Transposase DDE domain
LVTLVRQTEQQLLHLGNPCAALAQAAQHGLQRATPLPERQRDRLARQLQTAVEAHHAISTPSRRLTQGKRLPHCQIVNAYDRTIAPILKGKSNCPAQFGRKPGLLSEPTSGFIFALRVPAGNPSDPSYVLPMLDKGQRAIDRVSLPRRLAIHAVAGDLGINDAALREALHARGILTVGIPQTVAPIPPAPTQDEVRASLTAAGLHRKRTPHQVHLAFACGHSRPVVESHIASVLARGAGHIRYKGLQGAVVQMGMIVMAHNGAAMVRIRHLRLSKRAQKFRRLLGLRHRKGNQINASKN